MTEIFLFLGQMSPWNLVLIPNTSECGACRPEEHDHLVHLTQAELIDLTQYLNLSKKSTQLLGSSLWKKHLLALGTTFYLYQEREREFRCSFTFDEASSLVYHNNITDLVELLELSYHAMEWRLTHMETNRSLKAVLLNNENSFSFIPVGHSIEMKESHKSMERPLSAPNCHYING